MKLVLACGQRTSWCEFAQVRLREMGVCDPQVTAGNALSVESLNAKMSAVQGGLDPVSKDGARRLGRAWEIAAADVIVANAEKPIWGWSRPENLGLLGFWRDFEPSSYFILLYSSPSESLALDFGKSTTNDATLEVAVQNWIRFHEDLLEFYHANSDRSLLVHVERFEGTADSVSDALNERFSVRVNPSTMRKTLDRSPVNELIAHEYVKDHHAAYALFDELNNSADLPIQTSNSSFPVVAAAEEVSNMRLAGNNLELELAKTETLAAELHEELSQAKKQYHAKELELSTLREQTEAAKEKYAEKSKHAKAEIELVQLQLQQAQEELERYFQKYLELRKTVDRSKTEPVKVDASNPSVSAPGARQHIVDFRTLIEGGGWHHPEPQGRWAGAGKKSVIKLPRLAAQDHVVRVKIVDAVSLEHLRNLRLKVNGVELPSRLKILCEMGGRLAPLRRLKATIRGVEHPYPAEIRARIPFRVLSKFEGATELEFSSLAPVKPGKSNKNDNRTLSVCVQQLQLMDA